MCMLRYKWYRGSIPSPINEHIPGCGHTEGWRIERCEEARARCRGAFCEDPQPVLRLEDSYTMGDCRTCQGLRPFIPHAPPFLNPEQVDDPAYREQEKRRRQEQERREQEQEQREQEQEQREQEDLRQYGHQSQQEQEIYQQGIDRYEQERLRQRYERHRRYQEQNQEYARLQLREQALLLRRLQQQDEEQ
ncbi:hypothetical protein N7499_001302 [Penicillium canescens]|uniref:Uncharacterized protein n=1 Tax=Penicillium canescens TaxID=5083 RepID=A0AAD6I421_PENCN|nr:uncharacterized protein N7446_003557 [Penicillium canescens]KAJ6008647.1 hypothetical protein N7522_003663 [Penicillium canescens]KAJ6027844.1 hypothetical protein N7460_012661 [Penicillium canescens]KAJ6041126.1 hypothetical protein N7444_010031 [Penicillium canescens]KAJ6066520.1 hypothetical protein N7446_003557 [Penicillium canescens]KAJ6101672.1 hypothetical protein N7499_001302 [Penicillium canescens]